jgi:isoquinoline 1-oxidoreductase subunit beta
MSVLRPSRRTVLIGAGALGLLIGVGAWRLTAKGPRVAGTADDAGAFLHDWIHIGADGVVTIRAGRSEMGQGAFTGIATLVAEELGCRLDQLKVETGPASDAFKNIAIARDSLSPERGLASVDGTGFGAAFLTFAAGAAAPQITGGSSTLQDRFTRARLAGATAREMLIAAAAMQWSVPASECAAEEGRVVHAGSKRSLGFGELAMAAIKAPPPVAVTLKSRDQWTLIGKPSQRVDLPAKVDGSAQYGIDVRRPGMLFAAMMKCPTFGGGLKTFDDSAAKTMPGFVKALAAPGGVAVVADSTWRAKSALLALKVVWDDGPAANLDSPGISATLADALTRAKKVSAEGDFAGAFASAKKKLTTDYALPYLAHATMEPMNCTAEVGPEWVDVWAPTQTQTAAVELAAKTAGVSSEKVRLHTTLLGGGVGRRLESDFVEQAVFLAKAMGKPVQVIWSREEDIQHDFYRPAALVRMEGALDAQGKASAWRIAIASQSILARVFPAAVWLGPDETQLHGGVSLPYAIANKRTDLATIDVRVPVGFWRSVGHSIVAFAKESFVDELASAAGADPLAFRLGMLQHEPRLSALLKLAASTGGWGGALPKGEARGLALHTAFGTGVAMIAHIAVSNSNGLSVKRVVAAVDCGTIVNPDIVRAQIESAIIFGLSAALFGKITIKNGRVVEESFPDYRVVQMDNAPEIDVRLIDSQAPPGGIGEPGLPPLAPALANAIFAATGKRVRSLPLMDQGFSV